jgi:predicted nucleic acid-binding protein
VEGLGTQRSVLVGAFAAETGLRAADAVYAWLAKKYGATLLTLDDEVIRKSRDFYMAKHP